MHYDEFNEETQYYLKQAVKKGPFIDSVIVGSVQILLFNWRQLSGADQVLLFEQFGKAIGRNKLLGPILAHATELNRQKLLCLQIKNSAKDQRYVKSWVYKKYCI